MTTFRVTIQLGGHVSNYEIQSEPRLGETRDTRSDIGSHGKKIVSCSVVCEYLIIRVKCALQDKSEVDIFEVVSALFLKMMLRSVWLVNNCRRFGGT
jgi:hypothetical protein